VESALRLTPNAKKEEKNLAKVFKRRGKSDSLKKSSRPIAGHHPHKRREKRKKKKIAVRKKSEKLPSRKWEVLLLVAEGRAIVEARCLPKETAFPSKRRFTRTAEEKLWDGERSSLLGESARSRSKKSAISRNPEDE